MRYCRRPLRHSARTLPVLCAALVLAQLLASPAAEATGNEFDYPELLVTPRSSERLATEAAKEPSGRWTSQLPLQVSALSTLAAGVIQLGSPHPTKDVNGVTGWAGVAVGGAWLLTSVGLEAFYHPYASGSQEVSALPAKSPREQLTRERRAEEIIHAQARLASRIKWLAFLTQLGTNAYLITQAQSGSFSMVADGVAAAFSLAPIVFRHHWQDVSSEQDSYKKRIYAPIASAAFYREPATGALAPGVALRLSF